MEPVNLLHSAGLRHIQEYVGSAVVGRHVEQQKEDAQTDIEANVVGDKVQQLHDNVQSTEIWQSGDVVHHNGALDVIKEVVYEDTSEALQEIGAEDRKADVLEKPDEAIFWEVEDSFETVCKTRSELDKAINLHNFDNNKVDNITKLVQTKIQSTTELPLNEKNVSINKVSKSQELRNSDTDEGDKIAHSNAIVKVTENDLLRKENNSVKNSRWRKMLRSHATVAKFLNEIQKGKANGNAEQSSKSVSTNEELHVVHEAVEERDGFNISETTSLLKMTETAETVDNKDDKICLGSGENVVNIVENSEILPSKESDEETVEAVHEFIKNSEPKLSEAVFEQENASNVLLGSEEYVNTEDITNIIVPNNELLKECDGIEEISDEEVFERENITENSSKLENVGIVEDIPDKTVKECIEITETMQPEDLDLVSDVNIVDKVVEDSKLVQVPEESSQEMGKKTDNVHIGTQESEHRIVYITPLLETVDQSRLVLVDITAEIQPEELQHKTYESVKKCIGHTRMKPSEEEMPIEIIETIEDCDEELLQIDENQQPNVDVAPGDFIVDEIVDEADIENIEDNSEIHQISDISEAESVVEEESELQLDTETLKHDVEEEQMCRETVENEDTPAETLSLPIATVEIVENCVGDDESQQNQNVDVVPSEALFDNVVEDASNVTKSEECILEDISEPENDEILDDTELHSTHIKTSENYIKTRENLSLLIETVEEFVENHPIIEYEDKLKQNHDGDVSSGDIFVNEVIEEADEIEEIPDNSTTGSDEMIEEEERETPHTKILENEEITEEKLIDTVETVEESVENLSAVQSEEEFQGNHDVNVVSGDIMVNKVVEESSNDSISEECFEIPDGISVTGSEVVEENVSSTVDTVETVEEVVESTDLMQNEYNSNQKLDMDSFEGDFVDEVVDDSDVNLDLSGSQAIVMAIEEQLGEDSYIQDLMRPQKETFDTETIETIETVEECITEEDIESVKLTPTKHYELECTDEELPPSPDKSSASANTKTIDKSSLRRDTVEDLIENTLTQQFEDKFQSKLDLDLVSGRILVVDGEIINIPDDEGIDETEQEVSTKSKSVIDILPDHDYNQQEQRDEDIQDLDDIVLTEDVQEDNENDYDNQLVIDDGSPSEDNDEPPILEEQVNLNTESVPIVETTSNDDTFPMLVPMEKKKLEREMPKLTPIPKKKTNSRMTMAQLIERKLQGTTTEVPNNLVNGHETSKIEDDTDTKTEESSPKKPIIGSVRKSVRTSGRLTKPPWLTESEAEEENDEDVTDEAAEELPQEEGLTNGDMREKLASQLQALKVKKTSSLIDAKIPNFTKIDYKRRVLKGPKLSNVATLSPSPLGLKIVAVAGGVDIDSKEGQDLSGEGLDSFENCLVDEESDKSFDSNESNSANQVIINDHLDLPTIKLTKTKDYKKIKGWSKKKLLTLDAENEEAGDALDKKQPTPSCSYLGDAAGAGKDEPTKSESGNVFASNSLDGFLQEKDLNISYNVPNLKSSNSNINLLDACMLVDVEAEKSKSAPQPDNDDSNSSSSFKEKPEEKIAYKPRTLAEKRKMMSDACDVVAKKKTRGRPRKIPKVEPRKKVAAAVDNVEEVKVMPKISEKSSPLALTSKITPRQKHYQEDLLMPMDDLPKLEKQLPVEMTVVKEDKPEVVYLNEEDSKPRRCVTSQLRFRALNKQNIYSVVTRKVINRQFYIKCSDIKRKKTFDLVPIQPQVKPSILKTPLEDVKYKPGPLCKKQELQMSGAKDWETVVIDLPTVSVDVKPEIGKKLPPVVRSIVKFDTFEVSKERAEFALSVLTISSSKAKTADDQKTFTFPVKYLHNQEKVMMRRMIPRKKGQPKPEERKVESDVDIFNACESVISNMLDYVDVKEMEDGLLKYDNDAETKTEEKLHEVFPVEEVKSLPKGNGRKRPVMDKVDLELRRLNVRTVNIAAEEKMDTTSEKCTNFYCHMGCICHSISNRYPPSNHCGETKCIFNCVCGFEDRCKAIQEETKEDATISERTLSRFNKEAKRNITAREERDFTQTAIRHKDKTIILGNNRVSKRTPKFNFKRFEGFHFNFTEETVGRETAINETTTQKIIRTDKKLNHCAVNLVRCNFDDVVPFCLEHNLYDCHCKGLAAYTDNGKLQEVEELKLEERELKKKVEPLKLPHTYANVDDSCARFFYAGDYHKTRNKTNRYKNSMGRRLKYDPSVNSVDIVNRWVILPTHELPAKQNKPSTIVENIAESTHETITLVVDDDNSLVAENMTKQKRKRPFKPNLIEERVVAKPKPKTLRVVGSCLTISGALYSPTEAISRQFSAMIGYKTTPLTEFRLLLWPSMIELYENGDIHIWISSNTSKLRFIITDCFSNPKGAYTNIRSFEDADPSAIKVEFIKWIVSKSMPDRKNSKNILVILRIQEMFWEICGICAKNAQNQNSADPGIAKSSTDAIAVGQQETHPCGTPKEVIQTVDEKYYKTVQHVVFANGSFALKQLALVNNEDLDLGENRMAAALPHIVSNCKWRVLKVNSNFAILAFTRNEFRIKCSDILTVMKVAGKYDKTIIINTTEVSQNYQHKLFGIYIPPTFHDRIFIGPYLNDEDHGLETLRFVNNELMNTKAFNLMRGIKNVATTGLWYTQVGRASEPMLPVAKVPVSDSVIDLTDMDEVMSLMQSSDVTITPTPVALGGAKEKSGKTRVTEKLNFQQQSDDDDVSNDINSIVTVEKPDGQKIATSASLLIPCLQPDKTVKYQHVKLNLAPNVTKSARGFEHVNVDQLDQEPRSPEMPELIKIPPNPKRRRMHVDKTDNMYEQKQNMMDTMTLNNIIAGAKTYTSEELENCFAVRLTIIMRQMKLHLPRSAKPLCFRLNFGNGIILAYTHNDQVFVYWPGDCAKRFCFKSLDATIEWLSRELHEVFICVPSTFRIMVTVVGPAHYLEYINRGIISQKYFREICIIGDFGIMRLSEAEKYLMFDSAIVAKRCLRLATDKGVKFKRAIAQIIDCNDMTKEEFQKRVQDLIKRAKAAADYPEPQRHQLPSNSLTREDGGKTRKLSPATSTATAHKQDDVICLDSDEESDSPPIPSPPPPTPPVRTKKKAPKRLASLATTSNLRLGKLKTANLRKPDGGEDVMQIDLTHMTTEKVRELLRGHEYGDSIALTKAQVKRLRAYSRASAPGQSKSDRSGVL